MVDEAWANMPDKLLLPIYDNPMYVHQSVLYRVIFPERDAVGLIHVLQLSNLILFVLLILFFSTLVKFRC